jgi:hypothetical protein
MVVIDLSPPSPFEQLEAMRDLPPEVISICLSSLGGFKGKALRKSVDVEQSSSRYLL